MSEEEEYWQYEADKYEHDLNECVKEAEDDYHENGGETIMSLDSWINIYLKQHGF